MKNIVLMGFVGTGKTVIGRSLAGLLSFDFVETDEWIKTATGLLPRQILEKHGVRRFLSEQTLIYNKLSQKEAHVIAIGSLLIPQEMSGEPWQILRPSSVFVQLYSAEETLFKRVSRKAANKEYKKLSLDEFSVLLQEHNSVYEKLSDLRLKTDDFSIDEAARKIKLYYEYNI